VAGRKVRRPDLTLAVPDHNLPTTARRDASGARLPIADWKARSSSPRLTRNAPEFGIRYIGDAMPSRASSTLSARNRAFRCRRDDRLRR
jgi:3-isopropylmalate/(R)-2-methylmalate dehydratase large subunit